MPTTTPINEPIQIYITGPHNTGRSTLASYLKLFLEEHGFKHVTLRDAQPLSPEEKEPYAVRSVKNRERPIEIRVLTEGEGEATYDELHQLAAFFRSCALSGETPPEWEVSLGLIRNSNKVRQAAQKQKAGPL